MMVESKIVVCNGGYRTGSTLAYNICLQIAEATMRGQFHHAGMSHQEVVDLQQSSQLTSWWLIKSHDFIPKEVFPHTKIIHTCRHPLSVAASLCCFKPEGNDDWIIGILLDQKAMYEHHRDREDTLIIYYDDLLYDLPTVAQNIGYQLGLAVRTELAQQIEENLSIEKVKKVCRGIPAGGADPYTQLRHAHISAYGGSDTYWREVLSQSLIRRIFKEVGIESRFL